MPLLNVYRDYIIGLSVGASVGPLFDNANAHIAVGTGTAAYSVIQSNLQGTSERRPMDPGFPIRTNNIVVFQATFGGTAANFAWQEWGVANALTGGTMMNRTVQYNGTKLAGQTWILQVTNTLINAG